MHFNASLSHGIALPLKAAARQVYTTKKYQLANYSNRMRPFGAEFDTEFDAEFGAE